MSGPKGPVPARAAGALCLVAVAVVSGCAAPPGPSPGSPSHAPLRGAVAWIDAPPPPARPPATTAAPPPANARPCGRRDVSAAFDGRNGAGGHAVAYVRFRNVSSSTCLLAGYPRVVATRPGRPAVTATDGSFFRAGPAANMPPGGVTLLGLETDTYCAARPGGGGGRRYDHVSITLPGGGSAVLGVPRSIGFDVTCGLHLGRFFDPRDPQPEPVHPPAPLRAALALPRTVTAGSLLRFTVALRNPTAHPVGLTPCPGYVEEVATATPVKRSYALNCAPVRVIGPGRAVRFAMRLPIPAGSTPGPARVVWSLQAPDGAAWSTGAAVLDVEAAAAGGPSH